MTEATIDLSPFGTATLGGLIAALETARPDADVQFDFCDLAPTTLDSYRGYYDHLALGWKDTVAPPFWPTAKQLLAELRQANGRTYEGWKGGDYRMCPSTPVWVAKPGDTGSTAIVGVEHDGESTVVLITRRLG